MKAVLLAVAAFAGWLLWRRGRGDLPRVVVAWQDGSELSLRGRTERYEQLIALAAGAIR